MAYLAAFGVESYIRPFNKGVVSISPTGGIYDCDINRMRKVEVRALHRLEVIHNIIQTKETLEFQRGFLAGFFDAEGTGEVKKIRIYQKNIDVLRRVRDYAANLGFTFEIKERENHHCSSAVLRGGILERFRFFATCQPVLLRKSGLYGASMLYNASEILVVESGPVMDVVDIQTSTGTFFAAGLATHNCFRKKGGCGAKFAIGDAAIESQQTGRVPNAEIADQVNTIQKMGQKRSLIAATLLAVNASEFFTQDVEDFVKTSAVVTQAPSAASSYDEQHARSSVIAGGKKFSSDSTEAVGPGVEESTLRSELLAACRRLGKTEEQLVDWLKRKYEVAEIDGLTLQQKREVLAFLHNKIARERAA